MDLSFSVRKKKRVLAEDDDAFVTPKKSRLRSPGPATPRSVPRQKAQQLPPHLSRLISIQSAIEHTISLALATAGVAPSQDTGRLPNVINHISLDRSGHKVKFTLDDIKRLCWLWEWDSLSPPPPTPTKDDNPFLDPPPAPKDWTRGAMGLIITPTTHVFRSEEKRVPAYGIGIEVDFEDGGGSIGMGAVAKWTTGGEMRSRMLSAKLARWVELQSSTPIPDIPLADLPALLTPAKVSSLTHLLSNSPKKPSLSLAKRTPTKPGEFAVPFPVTPASSSSSRPVTPTSQSTSTPSQTPRTNRHADLLQTPQTPSNQVGPDAPTAPETPSSSRRAALYERIRQRSLSGTPAKGGGLVTIRSGTGSEVKQKMVGPEELRRRCLLGRLSGVAECVWMLFASPIQTPTPASRKRRTMPTSEIMKAVVKSSPVPISDAEAQESLVILTQLCPFFLRPLNVGGEEWLEMPPAASSTAPASPKRGQGLFGHLTTDDTKDSSSDVPLPSGPSKAGSPTKPPRGPPTSPFRSPRKEAAAEEILLRSPKRVKREEGGLRDVRERIRKELEKFEDD